MLRNRWPDQIGMGGQMLSDSVAEYQRNAQSATRCIKNRVRKQHLAVCEAANFDSADISQVT